MRECIDDVVATECKGMESCVREREDERDYHRDISLASLAGILI